MNLFDYITTFTKVVETGSFTKAGDALDISAAAVSKQINQLEASLGVSLLVRSTRRISITEAGNIIYNKSQQILNNVNELKPVMVAEDFSAFSQIIPGFYYFLGVKNPEAQTIHPLHSPYFEPDEKSIPTGIKIMCHLLLDCLQQQETFAGQIPE